MKLRPIFSSRLDIPSVNIFTNPYKEIDAYSPGLSELFFLENPGLRKHMPGVNEAVQDFVREKSREIPKVPIYLPWSNTIIRSLPEDLYFRLRTARNRNLITEDEQKNLRQLKVGIAGLSVGSNALNSLVLSGGPKNLKIADPDVIDVTNLNRLAWASLSDLGRNKAQSAAEKVWNLDPFACIDVYDEGLTDHNMDNFLNGSLKLNVLVEEMDNLGMKFMVREACRKNRIPVVMATDNGDTILIDVERFDLEPDRPLFHGRVGDIRQEDLLNPARWGEIASKIVGVENIPPRMMESIKEMGRTLSGLAQLGSTAMAAGAAISLVLRKMAVGEDVPSGRYRINLDVLERK